MLSIMYFEKQGECLGRHTQADRKVDLSVSLPFGERLVVKLISKNEQILDQTIQNGFIEFIVGQTVDLILDFLVVGIC